MAAKKLSEKPVKKSKPSRTAGKKGTGKKKAGKKRAHRPACSAKPNTW